jgi:hypothetical protein
VDRCGERLVASDHRDVRRALAVLDHPVVPQRTGEPDGVRRLAAESHGGTEIAGGLRAGLAGEGERHRHGGGHGGDDDARHCWARWRIQILTGSPPHAVSVKERVVYRRPRTLTGPRAGRAAVRAAGSEVRTCVGPRPRATT